MIEEYGHRKAADTAGGRLRILPMIVVMGLIFFLSHQTASDLDFFSFPFFDKIAHFLIYGILGLTAILAFEGRCSRLREPFFLFGIVIFCTIYGASDEFHQTFIEGRQASSADLFADFCGALAAVLGYARYKNAKARKQKLR